MRPARMLVCPTRMLTVLLLYSDVSNTDLSGSMQVAGFFESVASVSNVAAWKKADGTL